MNRINRTCVGMLLGLVVIAGCGQDSTSETPAASTPPSIVVNNPADPATNPVAQAAHDFMDAVIKGDKQRAFARLTPAAQQQIANRDLEFEPEGLANATFRVGEVRTPAENQAIVQCVINVALQGSQPHDEEICCLMRLVKNDWHVSGIAYSTPQSRRPTIWDFEAQPKPAHSPTASSPTQGAGEPATGRPSPPRTAQEAAPAAYR